MKKNFKFQISNAKCPIIFSRIRNWKLPSKRTSFPEAAEIGNSRMSEWGFTLVELIIYMGILIVLLTVLTTIFTQAVDTQLESQASTSVEQDGRYIITKLLYDINRASSITSPILGASSSSLQIVVSGVTYTYASSSGNFVLTNNSGSNNLNGFDTTVSNVSFQQIGNNGGRNTITAQFRLTSKTTRPRIGKEVRDFQTTAGIRY